MQINFYDKNKQLFVIIEGELDHHTSENFKELLENKLSNKKYDEIILDLDKLSFMDSSGIGVLIGRYKELKGYGTKLSVINVKPQVRKVFEISGLFKLIEDKGDYKNVNKKWNEVRIYE